MKRIPLHEARDMLGLTVRGLQAMAARGDIPGAAKIGRVWTFDAAKLDRWIRSREQATWQRAQDGISTAAERRIGRACKLPAATCGKAYARHSGPTRLAAGNARKRKRTGAEVNALLL